MPSKELISGEWKKVCSKADCHKAGIAQPIEGFSKNKSTSDGLKSKCKKCANTRQAEYYANNREQKKAYNAEHRSRPEIKAQRAEYQAAYRALPENKERRNQRKRDRYNSDSVYRTKCILSRSIRRGLKANGGTKCGKAFDYLPYSPEELNKHLEKQFDEHMNWDNHGTYWHIDHIKPHVMFNYDSLDHPDFQKCWALENLRPLKASENISKGSLWEGERHYRNEAA